MGKYKNKKVDVVNSQIERIKKLIKISDYLKKECDEFKQKKKIQENEIENVFTKVSNMNDKLEMLINNYK